MLRFKGTSCSLEKLTQVPVATRGYSDILEPHRLRDLFLGVQNVPLIATNVKATVFARNLINFVNVKQEKRAAIQFMGNVNVR